MKIFYIEAQRALASLGMSSDLQITMESEGLIWDYRNSPYVSRHGKFWTPIGHGVPELVKLENRNHTVFFAPDRYDHSQERLWCVGDSPLTGDCLTGLLPKRLFEEFFEWPMEKPDWFRDYDAVVAAIPDRFSGYDVDGRPMFEKNPVVRFRERTVYGVKKFEHIIGFECIKIGCKMVNLLKNRSALNPGDAFAEIVEDGVWVYVGENNLKISPTYISEHIPEINEKISPLWARLSNDRLIIEQGESTAETEVGYLVGRDWDQRLSPVFKSLKSAVDAGREEYPDGDFKVWYRNNVGKVMQTQNYYIEEER